MSLRGALGFSRSSLSVSRRLLPFDKLRTSVGKTNALLATTSSNTMIPLHLHISGFLSYRDPVELDFNAFDLACISGHNGAGKSSLLDTITWSLFGEARGKSSDVINLHADVKAAEVILTFKHEENTYRVQRSLPRGKSTVLEFQIQRGSSTFRDHCGRHCFNHDDFPGKPGNDQIDFHVAAKAGCTWWEPSTGYNLY